MLKIKRKSVIFQTNVYVCVNFRTRLRVICEKIGALLCAKGRKRGLFAKFPCIGTFHDLYLVVKRDRVRRLVGAGTAATRLRRGKIPETA